MLFFQKIKKETLLLSINTKKIGYRFMRTFLTLFVVRRSRRHLIRKTGLDVRIAAS